MDWLQKGLQQAQAVASQVQAQAVAAGAAAAEAAPGWTAKAKELAAQASVHARTLADAASATDAWQQAKVGLFCRVLAGLRDNHACESWAQILAEKAVEEATHVQERLGQLAAHGQGSGSGGGSTPEEELLRFSITERLLECVSSLTYTTFRCMLRCSAQLCRQAFSHRHAHLQR
jgi:hypothetical protein